MQSMKNFAPLFFLVVLISVPATAGKITSAYTIYDLGKCQRISDPSEEFSGGYICKGFKGNSIYWAEGDLRAGLGFGKKPATYCSVRQTFGGFNTVDSTVEWRLDGGKPFATIQRWRVSFDPGNAEKIKTWLVVTRLESSNSCIVAAIEGSLPKSNEKARAAADGFARTFNCSTQQAKVISKAPIAVDQLISATPCVSP